MTPPTRIIRPVTPADYAAWRPLRDGYNAFYGRHGDTALSERVTETMWQRFFDPREQRFALSQSGTDRLPVWPTTCFIAA